MTEQEKREKVVEGLEHEVARTDFEWLDCVEVALLRDALALLQAQEPRVMTLEEAAEADCCYVEYQDGDIFPVMVQRYDKGNFKIQRKDAYHIVVPEFAWKYGRFWTLRPTDEQRKATPWEREAQTYA